MSRLIDTHAHLQFQAYDEDRDFVAKRTAFELEAVVNVGTSLESSKKGVELSKQFPNFFASVGVHPHHVDQWKTDSIDDLEKLIVDERVVGVGEIGLDNHLYKDYPKPDLKAQNQILHPQIQLALKHKKPVLFHCRDAYEELFAEIEQYKGTLTGLMHCYMGTWHQAKKFLDLGLYISFSGNLTYKNNDYLREVAREIPAEKILTETDAPFLPPETYRGQRNEPNYVKMVATTISQVRGWSLEKTEEQTSDNAKVLLKLPL